MLRDHYIEMCLYWMAESGAIKWTMSTLPGHLTLFDCMSYVIKGSEPELHHDCRRHWPVNRHAVHRRWLTTSRTRQRFGHRIRKWCISVVKLLKCHESASWLLQKMSKNFQYASCAFIGGFVASAIVPLLCPVNFAILCHCSQLRTVRYLVWPYYHASQSTRKVSSWSMPGDTALPQTATMKTAVSLWYCSIIRV